jgi:hypothetical protein
MSPIRIAFVGRHQSGKTYAAHYLYKHHNFKTVKLQDGTAKVIKWFYKYRPHERVSWERRLAFYDALYELDNDIHVDYLLRRLAQNSTRDVVVDDVRYINEVNKLKDAGFLIIRISMPVTTKIKLKGISTAAPGSVKLNEYFNRTSDAYPTDYSIINENREALYRLLDNIVAKERAKRE